MKLTKVETLICEAFSERDENGYVKCRECPTLELWCKRWEIRRSDGME